jgi:hypothetical protein
MRLHPLTIVLSIPALFVACSSGGEGTPSLPSGPGVFSQPGASVPALAPGAPSVPGGQGPDVPPQDTGTTTQDTGGTVDTGSVQDTGSSECNSLLTSTCSADGPPPTSQVDTCRSQLAGSCASQWRTLYQCVQARRVCDTTTNATDWTTTLGLCEAEQTAASTCTGG